MIIRKAIIREEAAIRKSWTFIKSYSISDVSRMKRANV
jgi:hypothetical protein